MNRSRMTMAVGACLASLACAPALAQDANTVRVGLYSVFFHLHADDVSGPFTPPGLNADINNVNTMYFAYLRRVSSHLQAEVTLGLPPETDIVAKGPNKLGSVPWNGQVVGHVTWVSPSVLLEYLFNDESAKFRPYVGAGVNYTHFINRSVNAAGEAALGGPSSIDQTDSVGPAVTLGMSYRPAAHWQVITSVNWALIKSDLTINTAGIQRKTSADFEPVAVVFALGYSF